MDNFGTQNTANYMNGVIGTPQLLSNQITGGNNLSQLYEPQNYKPQSLNVPQANPFNTALLNAVSNSVPNAGTNHAVSNGGWPSYNQMSYNQVKPQSNNMMTGMFGNGSI